ncbi:hypothetical protein J8L97_01210 [Pseudoalteromonas sp. MMG012]|nr:hypothetical protein [Pseudoalteromonas sp. MMG012]
MFVWKLSQIVSLATFKTRERQQILALAIDALPPMQKVLLRIAKLCVLVPFFVSFAYIESWKLIPLLLIAGLLYPLLTSPIEICFAKPHLVHAIRNFQENKTTQA